MNAPVFTDSDFERMRELIYAKTGIRFDASKRSYVEKRVLDRLQAIGGGMSMSQYAVKLRFDGHGSELQELINLMTVNETYFFREEYQLRCMTNSMLPELVKRGSGSLRIWSMPCATGEEAYSIAIQLLERFPDVDNYEIEIVGSDIDTKVLAQAQRGIYSSRSLMHVTSELRERYFKRLDEDSWQVCDGLRDSVSFVQTNVVDRVQTLKCGMFDIAFCRNMLIYFDDVSRRKAVENIFEALRTGGFICLGHSESMSRITGIFQVRKFEDGIVYQKP